MAKAKLKKKVTNKINLELSPKEAAELLGLLSIVESDVLSGVYDVMYELAENGAFDPDVDFGVNQNGNIAPKAQADDRMKFVGAYELYEWARKNAK